MASKKPLVNYGGSLQELAAGDPIEVADGTAANHAVTKGQLDVKQPLNATLTAISDGTLGAFSHRNKIINGNFDIWQRGTSQTTNGYGSNDRWSDNNSGSTKTHSQQAFTLGQTEVPGEPKFFSRTVVTSVAGVGNFCSKKQPIEDVRTFAGKSVTVSFWAKADVAKNMALELVQNFGTGGTPSAEVVGIGAQLIPLTTAWQKFTKTIAVPSISGKTLGNDNNSFFVVQTWFDAGTDFNPRTASLGQQSGTFDIAQVQIEEGSVATPFEQRPIGVELALCQRYYFVEGGPDIVQIANGSNYSTTLFIGQMTYAEMRAAPALIYTGIFTIDCAGTALNVSALTLLRPTKRTTRIDATISGATVGYGGILNIPSNGTLALSAEL